MVRSAETKAAILTGHEPRVNVFGESPAVLSPEGELSVSSHGAPSPLGGQCVLDFRPVL